MNSVELKKISGTIGYQEGDLKLNVRIIKPYKQLYNGLIRVCLMFGILNLQTVNSGDFVDAAKSCLGTIWKADYAGPAEAFFSLCKTEVFRFEGKNGMEKFFEGIKCKLIQYWNAQIIEKSNGFKKLKIDK